MGLEELFVGGIEGEFVGAREGSGKTFYVVKKVGKEEPIEVSVSGSTGVTSCKIKEGDRFFLYNVDRRGLRIEIRSAGSDEVVHSYEIGTYTRRPNAV